MKKYFIISGVLLFFLSGCVCVKKESVKKEEIVEQIPEITRPPEIPEYKENFVESNLFLSEISEENQKETEIVSEVSQQNVLSSQEKVIGEEDVNIYLAKKEENISLEVKKKKPSSTEKYLGFLSKWKGECLIYTARWNFLKVGKGIVVCKEENNGYGTVYHLIGITIPEGTFAKLGCGYNRVDSFIDKRTLKPYYFYSYTKNRRKERIINIYFDWNKGEYKWETRKFKDGKVYSVKKGKVKYKGEVYDGMYVFYVMRTLNFENGKEFKFPVAMTKLWDLIINVKGKRVRKIPFLGRKEVYVIEPKAKSDEGFFRKGKMDVWITTDDKRIPVYLEGKVPIGRACLSLVSKIKIQPDIKFGRKTILEILRTVKD